MRVFGLKVLRRRGGGGKGLWLTFLSVKRGLKALHEDELPELDFTATTMRGRAWAAGRIRLPETPTLGLTLHEIAHIIQRHDEKDRSQPHGERFVKKNGTFG